MFSPAPVIERCPPLVVEFGAGPLPAEMMLRHKGWFEAADAMVQSIETTISENVVAYDFARLMEGAKKVSCSGFGQAMIE